MKEKKDSRKPGRKPAFKKRDPGKSTDKTFSSKKQNKPFRKPLKKKQQTVPDMPLDGLIRLNRYVANAGVCSRREADSLIKAGAISVNGKVVTEMGIKVSHEDVVLFGTQKLSLEKKQFLLLNKPKDYITTVDDPQGRKNVMELIKGACKERLYPVGRLDRNTTGLLLFTNDGELAKRLTHPKYEVKKIYHVCLNKKVSKTDMEKISKGIKLDDELVAADSVAYVGDGEKKDEVGIEIHSGQNRVVRRIFESLGYDVIKLDRVFFAGLTKKDIPRGKWRFLSSKEVGFLKMIK